MTKTSLIRRKDKETVAHPHNGILFSDKNEPWMDLEMIILSESDRERQTSNDIACMRNLKYDTNELIYKTDLQT